MEDKPKFISGYQLTLDLSKSNTIKRRLRQPKRSNNNAYNDPDSDSERFLNSLYKQMFKPKKKTKRDKIALRTQEESLKQDKLQTGGD